MYHFDKDLDPEIRKSRIEVISQHEKHLQTVTIAAVESGIGFLFTANAGGAVSVLTYLGAISSSDIQDQTLIKALACFFVGLVLIGIYRVLTAEVLGHIFRRFKGLTGEYYSEKMDWDRFLQKTEEQPLNNNIARILIYLSFLSFIIGSFLGTSGLFK